MLNKKFKDLEALANSSRQEYLNAIPYPHIVIDGIFDDDYLQLILDEFLAVKTDEYGNKFDSPLEKKLSTGRGDKLQGVNCKNFLRFLNSSRFLDFLQSITSIKEPLIPDPHFLGGGMHEIKRDGYLKIHADFSKHPENGLDRRINMLIYLNKEWNEEYGGHFELWDKKMKSSVKKILPLFNRTVIFNTTDFTFHGHPNPLKCNEHQSRKSLAMYYYSNGRPRDEVRVDYLAHKTTLFKERPNERFDYNFKFIVKNIIKEFIPPIGLRLIKNIKHKK